MHLGVGDRCTLRMTDAPVCGWWMHLRLTNAPKGGKSCKASTSRSILAVGKQGHWNIDQLCAGFLANRVFCQYIGKTFGSLLLVLSRPMSFFWNGSPHYKNECVPMSEFLNIQRVLNIQHVLARVHYFLRDSLLARQFNYSAMHACLKW